MTLVSLAAAAAESGIPLSSLKAALLALDAQLLDLATWLLAVRAVGIAGESNPLAVAAGPDVVVVAKVAGAVLLAIIAWRLAPSRWALLPALVGIVGAVTNTLALR